MTLPNSPAFKPRLRKSAQPGRVIFFHCPVSLRLIQFLGSTPEFPLLLDGSIRLGRAESNAVSIRKPRLCETSAETFLHAKGVQLDSSPEVRNFVTQFQTKKTEFMNDYFVLETKMNAISAFGSRLRSSAWLTGLSEADIAQRVTYLTSAVDRSIGLLDVQFFDSLNSLFSTCFGNTMLDANSRDQCAPTKHNGRFAPWVRTCLQEWYSQKKVAFCLFFF